MKYKDWHPILRLESEYSRVITKLLNRVFRDFDFLDSTRQIEEFIHSNLFYDLSMRIANHMITGVRVDNAKNWREAASMSTRGRDIYQALRTQMQGPLGNLVKAQIDYNASLIRSAPIDISRKMTHHIQQESLKGRRSEDIVDDLQKWIPNITRSRANLIARTEVSKASTALTRAQSYELGLRAYQWHTSEDGRVRQSHRMLDKVVVFWIDPPSPEQLDHEKRTYGHYHAGNIWNCRCFASPIIDVDYLPDTIKVYRNGSIKRMTKAQLKSII